MSEFSNSTPLLQAQTSGADERADGKYLVATLVICVLITGVLYEAAPFAIDFWRHSLTDTEVFALGMIPAQLCQALALFLCAKYVFPNGESVGERLLILRPAGLTAKALAAWTFFTAVATVISSNAGMILLEKAGFQVQEQAIMETTRRCGPSSLAVLFTTSVVIAPIIEEMFFRHVLYGSLNLILSKASSAVLASIIFSAIHFSLSFALPLFVLALLLQTMRIRYKSIVPGIIVHSVYNFLNVALLAMQMTE